MKQNLIQIAVLLMSYVAVNNAFEGLPCRLEEMKPVSFPQEYMLGEWRAAYCTESKLCSQLVNCAKYEYSKAANNSIILRVTGFNRISGKKMESEAEVKFPGHKGQFVVEDLFDIKLANFLMLHAEKHFCVLYACLVDQAGIKMPAAWISTKDDPENMIDSPELVRAMAVLKRNGLSFTLMHRPPYHDCDILNQMSAEAQEDHSSSM